MTGTGRAGIMSQPPTSTVDVRDMLCAQALAVVGHAIERLRLGERVEVIYNTEDVRQDLLVWAKDRGHIAQEVGPAALRLERAN